MKSLNTNLDAVFVGNEQVQIARECDFDDFIRFYPQDKKFKVLHVLKCYVSQIGQLRSPLNDLYRTRLSQLRTHLSA